VDLPVHGGLERILDSLGTTLDEEEVLELGRHGDAVEGSDKLGHGDCVDVRVGGVVEGNLAELLSDESSMKTESIYQSKKLGDLAELGVVHFGVVVTDGPRGEHAETVEVVLAGARVVEVHPVGLLLENNQCQYKRTILLSPNNISKTMKTKQNKERTNVHYPRNDSTTAIEEREHPKSDQGGGTINMIYIMMWGKLWTSGTGHAINNGADEGGRNGFQELHGLGTILAMDMILK